MEGKTFDNHPSSVPLAFVFRLAFVENHTVEYLGDKLRTNILTAEDLNRLLKYTPITNEPGHIDPETRKKKK